VGQGDQETKFESFPILRKPDFLAAHLMPRHQRLFLLLLCSMVSPALRAEAPPLLITALQRWTAIQGNLAFTQQTRRFLADGQVKEERIERYDPSLPDDRRWRLIEVDGVPATDEQEKKLESVKNGRPRRKVNESPSKYLDLDHAVLIGETPAAARFRIPMLPEVHRLVSLDDIDIVVTVDKQTGNVAGIGAALREPIRVLLGIARITDLDVDLRINPAAAGSADAPDDVESGSTARVKISRMGNPVDYNWSDFKRVRPFGAP
jgi:hypothetical protein